MRRAAKSLLVMASLKCPKKNVITCRPMGCETPGGPFPASGKETAGTALPQAPKQARECLVIPPTDLSCQSHVRRVIC
jgi:hypothetical protein